MMGFAFLGLILFYFAYRYNLLYVNQATIDTKGLMYAKALQHTTVGCYIGALCLIGLLAIRAAAGPLILMIVFLILMVLYHITMNSAMSPLLHYLPRSLEAEEDVLLEQEEFNTPINGSYIEKNSMDKHGRSTSHNVPMRRSSHNKPSFLKKFFRPDVYCNYAAMRRLVPRDFAEIRYSPEVERDAFQHPAVTNITPLLWVPRDSMGVSLQECQHTNKVTPMTDESAHFDAKGKVVWDEEETSGRAPIWEEKIYY